MTPRDDEPITEAELERIIALEATMVTERDLARALREAREENKKLRAIVERQAAKATDLRGELLSLKNGS